MRCSSGILATAAEQYGEKNKQKKNPKTKQKATRKQIIFNFLVRRFMIKQYDYNTLFNASNTLLEHNRIN